MKNLNYYLFLIAFTLLVFPKTVSADVRAVHFIGNPGEPDLKDRITATGKMMFRKTPGEEDMFMMRILLRIPSSQNKSELEVQMDERESVIRWFRTRFPDISVENVSFSESLERVSTRKRIEEERERAEEESLKPSPPSISSRFFNIFSPFGGSSRDNMPIHLRRREQERSRIRDEGLRIWNANFYVSRKNLVKVIRATVHGNEGIGDSQVLSYYGEYQYLRMYFK